MEKQKYLAEEAAVLGIKDGVDGKQRVLRADGVKATFRGDGTDDGDNGTNLTGVAGVINAVGGSAAGILSAISMITNKHTIEERYDKVDADINVNGSQSLDVNAKKWIGIAAASAAVIVVALILIFKHKN